jgi:hypothetical protein
MALLLLLALLSLSSSAHGYGPGRWINAHATFYGGGDASGTMGNLSASTSTIIYVDQLSAACNERVRACWW